MKSKSFLSLFLAIILAVCAYIIWYVSRHTKPTYQWKKTYGMGMEQPFDFGFFKALISSEKGINFSNLNGPISKELLGDIEQSSTYVFIGDEYQLSKKEFEALMEFIQKGGNAWISAEMVDQQILNKLKVKDTCVHLEVFNQRTVKVQVFETNDSLLDFTWKIRAKKSNNLKFDWYILRTCYSSPEIMPLASIEGEINYIKMNEGKGVLYLHTTPLLFSNYSLINDSIYRYVNSVFSEVSTQFILFDNGSHRKSKTQSNEGKEISPLNYILKQKSLRWAWYGLCLLLVLVPLFYFKRKQRIIPLIPQKNSNSIDLLEVLNQWQMKQTNYKEIAQKRMEILFIQLAMKANINRGDIRLENLENLPQSLHDYFPALKALLQFEQDIKTKGKLTKKEFKALNQHINQIKNKQ